MVDLLPNYGRFQSLGTDSTNENGDMGGGHMEIIRIIMYYKVLYIYT